jgi:hypothetical protein
VTDDGSFSVYKDKGSNFDYIVFSISEWNSIMNGTSYTITESLFPIEITICINLASRRRNCNGGLGFRCGLTDCNDFAANPGNTDGRNKNRIYGASYTRKDNTVILTFKEKVDWLWLQN